MELGGVHTDDRRPASSASGTDNSQATTGMSEVDEEILHLLPGSSTLSEDGRTQPLLKPRKGRRQFLYHLRHALGFLLANWYKFVILGLVITMIVMVSIHGFSIFGSIFAWFKRRNGWGGWGIFIPMYMGVVALFIPGVAFIMAAGFVFGFWRGLLAVWIGGAVGQALAFLLARYLLRDWVESFVQSKWKKWKYINCAIEQEGWKLVLIMRLSPVIPYNLLNIAMATTSIHFWQFTLVSAVGIIFECAVFCYIGSMAENVTSIVSGEAGPPKAIQWVLLGLSLTMCVVGAVWVSMMVKKAIKKAEEAEFGAGAGADTNGLESDLNFEDGQPLLSTSPTSLERESFISSITGYGRGEESSGAMFELKPTTAMSTPERMLPMKTPGTITAHLQSASKAKTSPRAENQPQGTPFKRSASDALNDVELGQKMSMSARRRSTRPESDDEN